MAKARSSKAKLNPIFIQHDLPEGFEEKSVEIRGFLDPDGDAPIRFVPEYAKLIDNSADNKKSSVLIVGTYSAGPAFDSSGDPIDLERGDLVGLWYKPGMKAVSVLAGVEVFMFLTAQKDTGKPNPMSVYMVAAPHGAVGKTLVITEDHRKSSKDTIAPFPVRLGAEPEPF